MLADVFQSQGLTTLALAYVMEEGLPKQFSKVPIDSLEAAAKRLHDMGYEKVGLLGISKGAELVLTAGSLAERKVFQRRQRKKQRKPTKSQNGFTCENVGICFKVVEDI